MSLFRVFALGVVGVCLVTILLSSGQLQQEINVHSLRTDLAIWQSLGYVQETGNSRERVLATLTGYDRSRINDADFADLGAQVYEWLAYEARLSRQRAMSLRQQGLEFALSSIQQRPASAIGWSYYLSNILLTEGYTLEVENTLHRVHKLGGWELETQRYLSKWGINYWDSLNADGQAVVLEMVRRVLQSDTTHQVERVDLEIIRFAHQRNWLAHLQPLLVNDDQRANFKEIASG